MEDNTVQKNNFFSNTRTRRIRFSNCSITIL